MSKSSRSEQTGHAVGLPLDAGVRPLVERLRATELQSWKLDCEAADELERLQTVIRRAADIMAGGEGVQDQGEAWDRALRLLDDALRPNVEVSR